MPRKAYSRCRDCKAPETPYRHISARGLCQPCALERNERGIRRMKDPTSDTRARWRQSMLDYLLK